MNTFVFALLALAAGFAPAAEVRAQDFVIIVNAANPVSELSASDVSNAFLKKAGKLNAVDLDRGSPVREAFSRSVHGRQLSAIIAYWQQQIFAGKNIPPVERRTDADVLSFVRADPAAIGYVAANTAIGDGVKVVRLK